MGKEILFIAHDAGYTGAPIILYNLLRWLKANTRIPFRILLRNPGPLESRYRQLAPVVSLGGGLQGVLSRHLKIKSVHNLLNRREQDFIRRQFSKQDFSLVYGNTATNGRILEALSGLDCPAITHIHELENWIKHRIGEQDFNLTKAHTDCFIAVSEMVRKNLVDHHAIPPQNIELVHEFIDTSSILHSQHLSYASTVRREINIAEDALIVGSCGTTDLRKGVDLFIRMEERLPKKLKGKPVHLVWVGRSPGRWESRQLEEMMASARLNDRIHFVGEKIDPHPYFASFDVFALTSREDPFPLVMLEAAAHSKPIICFRDSGGAPEFVGDDCGICVAYLDVDQMSSAVETLLSNKTLAVNFGLNARKKVTEQHDVSIGAPRVLQIVQRFLAD